MFFNFFSTIKVKLVDEMMQTAYSCVILHVKHKKLPFIAILTWFLAKTKMATIFGDVTVLQQHHPPWNIPHLVSNIKGFPLKTKSFLNTATYQKLWGGVPSTSGLSLVPRWEYEFACKSEGWVRKEMYRKICGKGCWYLHRHASTSLINDNQTVAEICWASVIGSAQFSIVC